MDLELSYAIILFKRLDLHCVCPYLQEGNTEYDFISPTNSIDLGLELAKR